MKEIHTHNCTYEYINENYTYGNKLRFVALYDDNGYGLFCINLLEGYKQDELVNLTSDYVDKIANYQLKEVVELMENLIQMSDYQLCKWLSLNVKYFKNCEIKEIGSHSNEEHNFIIGKYGIKISPKYQGNGFPSFLLYFRGFKLCQQYQHHIVSTPKQQAVHICVATVETKQNMINQYIKDIIAQAVKTSMNGEQQFSITVLIVDIIQPIVCRC